MQQDPLFKYKLEDEEHVVLGYFESAHGLAEPQRTLLQHKEISLFGFENGYLTPEGQQWILEAKKCKSGQDVLYVYLLSDEGEHFALQEIHFVYHILTYGEGSYPTELLLAGGLVHDCSTQTWKLLEAWSSHKPQKKNLWTNLSRAERRHWYDACSLAMFPKQPDQAVHKMYEMDASYVTDYVSFFIALGEAINGPCGYFGMNIGALNDCLCGGFGAQTPFTLKIRHAKIAQQHLTAENMRRHAISQANHYSTLDELLLEDYWYSLWDMAIQTFHEHHITVQLLE